MMKHYLISIIVFTFVPSMATAQQRPYYTQYILNNYIINPAVAGIESYTDIHLSHRHQWAGLEGAPVTTYFTVSAPLGGNPNIDRQTATTNNTNGEFPRGRILWNEDAAAPTHHGIGGTILNDATGPLNRFAMYVTYALHLGLAPNTNLSLGVNAGFSQLGLNTQALNFGQISPVDPVTYNTGVINKINPDVALGFWIYGKQYFIGLAAQNIITQKVYFSSTQSYVVNADSVGTQIPHLFGQVGYKYVLNENVSMLPSIMVRYVTPLPIGIDLNVKFLYQNYIWVGANYRYQDGFAAMLGLNITNHINLGYSYDYSTSALRTVSNGTHELVLGFLLNNSYVDLCPSHSW